MQPALMTLNAGSSSLKFSLFVIEDSHLQHVFYGQIDFAKQPFKFLVKQSCNEKLEERLIEADEHKLLDVQAWALKFLLNWLSQSIHEYTICAVGHRIVHAGDFFTQPVIIDSSVIEKLEILIPLAPLHQPYNIAGIKAVSQQMPQVLQVGCFDTAFHSTQPQIAKMFALPEKISTIPIKRYGFHGLSYEYIAQVLPDYLEAELAHGKIIVAHLGHGASMCAMHERQSMATTMGLTALDGLPMGTRCGNIDPGIILYLLQSGMSLDEITTLLYKQSGLLGISGISSDTRILLEKDHPAAKKALDVFVYRIVREVGSLIAALNGLDGIVFTAGIGENSAEIRKRICEQAQWLNIRLDEYANQKNALQISKTDSRISIWVIPTNEELIIAQHTFSLWQLAKNF